MALVVNAVGRHGLSNEMHRQLRLKKSKVTSLVPRFSMRCLSIVDR